jgi:translation initiation factor IF-2
MTDTAPFKKIRLFKISKELNISVDSILTFLSEEGLESALAGQGVNASINDEDAYIALLDAFSADKAAAAKVRAIRDKRIAREAEAEQASALPEPPPELPAEDTSPEEPSVEPSLEPTEQPAPEVVIEDTPEASTEDSAPEEVEVAQKYAEAEDNSETALDDTQGPHSLEASEEIIAPESVVEEPSDADAVQDDSAEKIEEPATLGEDETSDVAPTVPDTASETVDPVQALSPEETIEGEKPSSATEDPAGTIMADRYKLQGTRVLGKIDLAAMGDDGLSGRRKRKRKKADEPSASQAPSPAKPAAASTDKSGRDNSKKASKKKGPKVEQAEVEQTLQDTLRELEQGASRARQKRRRERRDAHEEKRQRDAERESADQKVLKITEFVSTGELANLIEVSVNEVIGTLFSVGLMVSINQRLDAETISLVAEEYGYVVEFISDFEEVEIEVEADDESQLLERCPVVTVMGHVDHGKTSLLDYIRRENVVAGEAGGITQHIGAYNIKTPDGRQITFLDTPGHEAFTAMRARGAQVTDIVIIVVAADDSVMRQTVEAINHARAASVPMIVAINKVDKPTANVEKVMQQLTEHNVIVEQYGGDVPSVSVSALNGTGMDDLLEVVGLQADLLELKANPNRKAQGTVIESRLDKGKGVVSTVLVQNGTLKVGDIFVAGIHAGRVRALFDERENRIDHIRPGYPTVMLGLAGQPDVGDRLVVMDDEREAREIAQRRQQIHREQSLRQRKHITLDEIGRRLALGDFKELNLIVKADVGGSAEAVCDSLLKLSTPEVALNIIHDGVGAITEGDVMLASASDAIIIGFNVRPSASARQVAEREEIDIRTYSVIYKIIEDVKSALEGLLSPEETERTLGTVEVRETFKVPKVGTIAGCYVIEGKINRNNRMRVIRDGVVIYETTLASLKRFKDDVREVATGYECGIGLVNYDDVKVGDQYEAFEIVESKRTLDF